MLRSLCLAALLLATAAVHAAVPPSLSGSWYDPVRPGHGLSIQVLGDGRAIAYWFTYDRDGDPLHLYLDGRVDFRTIRGTAYAASGMRFGSFDPASLGVQPWGEIAIEFTGGLEACDAAVLRYDGNGAAGAGFGAGEITLARLSNLEGLRCNGASLDPHRIGLYAGSYQRLAFPISGGTQLEAAVDTDGLLWAFSIDPPPGPTWVGAVVPPVVVPARSSIGGAGAVALDRVLPNFAFYPWHQAPNADDRGEIRVVSVIRGLFQGTSTGGASRALHTLSLAEFGESTARLLAGRLDPATLAGARYYGLTRGQFVTPTIEAEFASDGSVCLRYPEGYLGDACYLQGRITVRSTTHRFFDFELTETANGRVYRGRGWVHAEDAAAPTRVVLVGSSDDGIGLGLGMARR